VSTSSEIIEGCLFGPSELTSRLILVGQAPNRVGNPLTPLEGRAGAELCSLFGCTMSDYLHKTVRLNVLHAWPGKAGKGDRFPKAAAKVRARKVASTFNGRQVLFVGLATAEAFGVDHDALTWQSYGWRMARGWSTFKAAIVPHPSGINRWWNSARHRRAARRFMRKTWRAIIQ